MKIPSWAFAATPSQINSQIGILDAGFYKIKERPQRRSATRLSSLTGFSVVRQLPGLFTLYCFCFFCCQPTLRPTGPASISDLSASHTDGMTPIFPSSILSRLHLHVNTPIRRRSFLGELFLFFFMYLFPKSSMMSPRSFSPYLRLLADVYNPLLCRGDWRGDVRLREMWV